VGGESRVAAMHPKLSETDRRADPRPGTLGALLRASRCRPASLEQEWVEIIQSIADG